MTISKVDQFGTCQAACDLNYGVDPADTNKICKKCYEFFWMNQFGICKISCDLNWIESPPENICVECKYQFGVCQWKCDPGYIHDTTAGNVCKTCYDMVYLYF